jgi:phosphate:Na+ symporter
MPLSGRDSRESAMLLHMIGDLERISDHAVNVLESAEELRDKELQFSEPARKELQSLFGAVRETVDWAMRAFVNNDLEAAHMVEPLESIVDVLKSQLRIHHVERMQKGLCSIETGFIWSDLLTNLERVSDHCANIAGCVMEMSHKEMNLHSYAKEARMEGGDFTRLYKGYAEKYLQVLED